MDHNTMNFDRKFYQCNEVLKDCNVKQTIQLIKKKKTNNPNST